MKFDLEAAKRGEPIECLEAYGWVSVRFIGPWDSESAVCAVDWSYRPEIVLISKLRMAKKRDVVRYRVYLWRQRGGLFRPGIVDQLAHDKLKEVIRGDIVEWVHTDWQEYEIGAND